MKKYIGTKIVEAEKAWRIDGKLYSFHEAVPRSMNREEGYKVVYEDGYESWSPDNVFEKSYLQIGKNNTVNQQNVDEFITRTDIHQMGNKTVVVMATLVNGFIITESSSCVDPKNFDIKTGEEICMAKIKDKVWFLLGFLLQCGNGLNQQVQS